MKDPDVLQSNTFDIFRELRQLCAGCGLDFNIYTACGPGLGPLDQVKLPGEGQWSTDHIFGCYLDCYDGMFILGTANIEGFEKAQTAIVKMLKKLRAKHEVRSSWWCVGSGKDCHAVDVTELCIFPKHVHP